MSSGTPNGNDRLGQPIDYPLDPLFDARLRTLTPKCRAALTEIFNLCDHDQDKLMNDDEIIRFQDNCFGTPLKRDALDDLKNIVRQSTIDGIINDSLTLDGFLFLHALSIEKGRQDFTWQVLRNYHFNDELDLEPTVDEEVKPNTSRTNITEESISSLVEDTEKYLTIDQRSKIRGSELISQLDISPWLRDNPRMVKTGLGITVTTFISFIALRFLIQARS